MDKIRLWILRKYEQIVSSIAFLPAIISLGFFILSAILFNFDISETGQQLKEELPFLSLKDSSTARSILDAIVGGVISLTVFSFSMVMIVLNQAASQMSNRILDKLIGNRFQQIVLGFYIGTIIYSFFIFSTIRDTESRIQIPSISIFILTVLTVLDLFIFIYFLHFITQSVKYEVIIKRIKSTTYHGMKNFCVENKEPETAHAFASVQIIRANKSGIFEGYDSKQIMNFCEENECSLLAMHPMGTFILRGQPVFKCSREIPEDQIENALQGVIFSDQESVERNYEYGLRQLSEIALKALSPGVNDPGTAIIGFRELMDLFQFRGLNFPANSIRREGLPFHVIRKEHSFDTLFERVIYPIWDYGQNDRMLIHEFNLLVEQLSLIVSSDAVFKLLKMVRSKRESL